MQPLAPRRVLWNLACECTRRGRIGRGVLRRRLGAFLARSGAGRLRTILRSAALAGVVAAALLGSSPALAQAIELAEVAGGQGGFIVRSEPLEISPSEASAFGWHLPDHVRISLSPSLPQQGGSDVEAVATHRGAG